MREDTHLNASSVSEPNEQTPQNQDPYATCKLPENSVVSATLFTALKEQAATLNLPPELLQTWVKHEDKRLQQEAHQQEVARQAQTRAWAQETQALFGPTWEEEVSRAVRAADVFGGPELRQLLEETGLGNHPAIVRTFAAVGKRIAEDVYVGGANSSGTDKTFTQALYGKE